MKRINAIVVDDNPLALEHMIYEMKAFPHIRVRAAFTGADAALAYLQQHDVDCVFLDIVMPGMDGLTLADKLLCEEKDYVVVFITSYDDYGIEAWSVQARDYIMKPVRADRLKDTIARVEKQVRVIKNRKRAIHTPKNTLTVDHANNFRDCQEICVNASKEFEQTKIRDMGLRDFHRLLTG